MYRYLIVLLLFAEQLTAVNTVHGHTFMKDYYICRQKWLHAWARCAQGVLCKFWRVPLEKSIMVYRSFYMFNTQQYTCYDFLTHFFLVVFPTILLEDTFFRTNYWLNLIFLLVNNVANNLLLPICPNLAHILKRWRTHIFLPYHKIHCLY